MERLTVKNEQFDDYCVAEYLRKMNIRQYLYIIIQKMGKYEDLEEELGCHLEENKGVNNMKRSITEIYKLLESKINEARLAREIHTKEQDFGAAMRCYGNIEAYTDILCLIESSHLLEEDHENR